MNKLFFPIFVMLLLVFSISVTAYPIIISEQGVNHTQAKELVYSIPEEYYEYVDIIEFVNKPICRTIDEFGQKNCWDGWYWIYWNNNHQCHNGKIIIYRLSYEMIQHELGHIYQICNLKQPTNDEEFAYSFRIARDRFITMRRA